MSAADAEIRIRAPVYSKGNLIWRDCRGCEAAVNYSPAHSHQDVSHYSSLFNEACVVYLAYCITSCVTMSWKDIHMTLSVKDLIIPKCKYSNHFTYL